MKSKIAMVVLLGGCVAGNPGGPGEPKADAGASDDPLQGGSFQLEQCGYAVTTRQGASAPVLGSAKLGPDPAPYQLHLGIAGPAATSMVVTWATHDQSTLATTVQYGKKDGGHVTDQSVNGLTWIYGTGFSGNGDPVRVHETHLCGLEPATVYVYRVGGVGEGGAEKWSEEHEFRTAPLRGADASEQVTVVVLGDTRGGYATWGELLASAITKTSPDLILFTGDAVNFGQIQEDWDAFLEAGEPVLRQFPMIAAHGNHDTNSINFFSLLAMPGNEQTFGLDYGPFHLTVLNDSPEDNTEITGKQRDFLAQDLAAHDADPWKLVMHHKPIYSAAGNHGSELILQNTWAPLYDQHHVDLVINGHDHDYERTYPMFAKQVKSSPAEGTVYLVAGSAGAELYDAGMKAWTAYSEKTQNFVVLKIRAGELDLQAYRADGSPMDHLHMTK
jgi:acid phosphatase type 7